MEDSFLLSRTSQLAHSRLDMFEGDHSCKTKEPSIFLSVDIEGGKFKGENSKSFTLEDGAGLNS